jgi:hypothetical protein
MILYKKDGSTNLVRARLDNNATLAVHLGGYTEEYDNSNPVTCSNPPGSGSEVEVGGVEY